MIPSNIVNFTEHYQQQFTTHTLIPISVLTDSDSLSYLPGNNSSGQQVLAMFTLVNQLAAIPRTDVTRVIAIGDDSPLLAKLLLNTSFNYTVDALVRSSTERETAERYVNSPNLFKALFVGGMSVPEFDKYDVVVFTDAEHFDVFPTDALQHSTEIFAAFHQTDQIHVAFDLYPIISSALHLDTICTQITAAGKIFIVNGRSKNESN